jgi:integrase
MSKRSKERIACEYFFWKLFLREEVFYADGRHNKPNVGKHSLGTRDREEALRALHQLDHRKAVELKLAKPKPSSELSQGLPITEGWGQYLAHVARPDVLGGAGPLTCKRYKTVRDKHETFCKSRGLTDWRQITKHSVEAYAAHLKSMGRSDSSVYLECTVVKQVVKWLIEELKVLPESHRIKLKLRRSTDSDTYCYTREQNRAMVELCRSTPNLEWLANVFVALSTTGMRIGELESLRWTDVDLTSGVITLMDNRHSSLAKKAAAVRTTKGRRSRRIHIHDRLREVLEKLPHRENGGYVFRALGGGKLDADKVLKVLKRDVLTPLKSKFPTLPGEIGFEHGGLHSFRHYFVTEAFLGGATDGEVRDWVGHRDSRIVERYRHLRDRDAKRTMNRLDFLGEKAHHGNQSANKGETSDFGANGTGESKGGRQVGADKTADSKTNGKTDGPNVSAPE